MEGKNWNIDGGRELWNRRKGSCGRGGAEDGDMLDIPNPPIPISQPQPHSHFRHSSSPPHSPSCRVWFRRESSCAAARNCPATLFAPVRPSSALTLSDMCLIFLQFQGVLYCCLRTWTAP